jgi:hypothetical protein
MQPARLVLLLCLWKHQPDKLTLRNNCIIILFESFFLQPHSRHTPIFSVSSSSINIFHVVLKVVRNGLGTRALFIPASPAHFLSFILVVALRHLRYMACKLWCKEEAFHYHAARIKSAVKHVALKSLYNYLRFPHKKSRKGNVIEGFSNLKENLTFNWRDFRLRPRCK